MGFGSFYKINHDTFDDITERNPLALLVFNAILRRVRWNGNRKDLPLGCALIGQEELAEHLTLSRQQVRTALHDLATLQHLTVQKSTRSGTVVKVNNPQFYTDSRAEPNQQPTHAQPSLNHGLASNIELESYREAKASLHAPAPSELEEESPSVPIAEVPERKKEKRGTKAVVDPVIEKIKQTGIRVPKSVRWNIVQTFMHEDTDDDAIDALERSVSFAIEKDGTDDRDRSSWFAGAVWSHLERLKEIPE